MEDPGSARRLRAAALGAAALVALSGCGGSSSPPDSTQVRTVVLDYAHAFGAGDGRTACAQLSPAARVAFVRLVAILTRTGDCATAVQKLQQAVGPQAAAAFRSATVSEVRVSGTNAGARLRAGSQSALVRLSKQGGRWRLAAAPGIAG